MNLDSLLDTLTNVVGFLMILLVLMHLGAGEAVKRIRTLNPEAFGVRPEDLEQKQTDVELQRQTIADLLRRLAELTAKVKVDEDALAKLKDEKSPAVVAATMSLEDARRLLEERQKKAEQLQVKFTSTDSEIARLKALLDKTPGPRAAPPPVNVSVPDPKPAPPGAKGVWFVCHRGRVVFMDVEALQDTAVRSINAMKTILQYRPPGYKPSLSEKKSDKPIEFDAPKVEEHFKRNAIGNATFTLKVRTYEDRTWASLLVEPRETAGETAAQIRYATSTYQSILRKVSMQKEYVRFLVAPDSYPIYLDARAIADRFRIPAGWELSGSPPVYWTSLPGIRFHQRVEPPPPPPGAKPPPSGPKPPDNVID